MSERTFRRCLTLRQRDEASIFPTAKEFRKSVHSMCICVIQRQTTSDSMSSITFGSSSEKKEEEVHVANAFLSSFIPVCLYPLPAFSHSVPFQLLHVLSVHTHRHFTGKNMPHSNVASDMRHGEGRHVLLASECRNVLPAKTLCVPHVLPFSLTSRSIHHCL